MLTCGFGGSVVYLLSSMVGVWNELADRELEARGAASTLESRSDCMGKELAQDHMVAVQHIEADPA